MSKSTPSRGKMIRDLNSAGWVRHVAAGEIWEAPWGLACRGLENAWSTMKAFSSPKKVSRGQKGKTAADWSRYHQALEWNCSDLDPSKPITKEEFDQLMEQIFSAVLRTFGREVSDRAAGCHLRPICSSHLGQALGELLKEKGLE